MACAVRCTVLESVERGHSRIRLLNGSSRSFANQISWYNKEKGRRCFQGSGGNSLNGFIAAAESLSLSAFVFSGGFVWSAITNKSVHAVGVGPLSSTVMGPRLHALCALERVQSAIPPLLMMT
jgi:hypothetical protein